MALGPEVADATALGREIFEAIKIVEMFDLEMSHGLGIGETDVDGHSATAVGLRARSTVIQQRTGRAVPFDITEPAREALASWLEIRDDRDAWVADRRRAGGLPLNAR